MRADGRLCEIQAVFAVCLEPCGMFNTSRSADLFSILELFVPVDTQRWCLFVNAQTQIFSGASYSVENTTHQLARQWQHFLFPVWLTFLSQSLNLGLCEIVCFGLLLARLD